MKTQSSRLKGTVLDQKNKPTRTPTLRRIFQAFQAVHLMTMDAQQQVSNLSENDARPFA